MMHHWDQRMLPATPHVAPMGTVVGQGADVCNGSKAEVTV
jgi:hypothetical protein